METTEISRYFYFFFGSLFVYTVSIFAFFLHPKTKYFIFGMLVFCLCLGNVDIHFFSMESYRQATRGLQVHMLDILVLALLTIGVVGGDLRKPRWIIPLTIPTLLYFLLALFSWIAVPSEPVPNPGYSANLVQESGIGLVRFFYLKWYPIFEISKIVRGYVVFWLFANLCRERGYLRSFDYALLIMAFWLLGYALYERYILGVVRISGPLDHPNEFNTFVGMVGAYLWQRPFFFRSSWESLLFLFGAYGCMLSVILTVSRSSLAGLGLAILLGTLLCLPLCPVTRWLGVVTTMFASAILTLAKAFDTLMERFISVTQATGVYGRDMFWGESYAMAAENFFGVGLGNFSAYLVLQYGSEEEFISGIFAHNIWSATLAEVGFLGLFAFVFYWLRVWQLAAATAYRGLKRREPTVYYTVIGVVLALIVLSFQMWYHQSYRVTPSFFLAHAFIGVMVSQYLAQRQHHLQRT